MTGESCLACGWRSTPGARRSALSMAGRVVAVADLGWAALSWWWRGQGLLTRVGHDRRWEACLLVGVDPGRCAACPGGAEVDGRNGVGGGRAAGACGAGRSRGQRVRLDRRWWLPAGGACARGLGPVLAMTGERGVPACGARTPGARGRVLLSAARVVAGGAGCGGGGAVRVPVGQVGQGCSRRSSGRSRRLRQCGSGGLVVQRWRSQNRARGSRLRAGLDSSACAPGCLRPAKGAGLLVGVLYRWRLQRPGISATCVRCVPSAAGQAGAVHGGLDLLLSAVDLGRAVVPRYSGGRRTPSSGSALAYLFVHPERVRLVVSVRLSPGDAFGPSFLFGLFFLVFLGCGAETEVDGRRVGGGPDVPVGRAGRQAAAARHTGYRGRGQVRRRGCAGGGA